MNTPNEYTAPIINEEEERDALDMLKTCLIAFCKNWYWFLLSVIVCCIIGTIFYYKQTPVYKRQAVMLIEDAEAGSSMGNSLRRGRGSNMSSLLELNGVSIGDNLKNEIFILSSKRLMLRVVDSLHLDVDYTVSEKLHQTTLYGRQRPIEVLFPGEVKSRKGGRFIQVEKKDENTVILKKMVDRDGNEVDNVEARLGEMVRTPYGKVCIVRGQSFANWEPGEDINVSQISKSNAANRFMGEIGVSEYDKESTLIVLSCSDNHIQRAEDILNKLFDTYKMDVVENKNRVAKNTGDFIDERIQLISRELTTVENQMAGFKKDNNIVDFDNTTREVLSQASTARQQSLAIETQLNVAQYLSEYLANQANEHDLIPALNIGESGFNAQIKAYNDLMNQRNMTASNVSENQSVVREFDRQLKAMHSAINSSLKSYVNSLQLQLRDAQANEAKLTGTISQAPEQQKKGLDIQRQQSLKEALYTYLLNKREEVALQQAINEANVRLVEPPIGNDTKVAPSGKMFLMVSFVIGLLIPAVVIYLRRALDMTVHSRKDIEEVTGIPILGEIPRLKNSTNKTLLTDLDSDASVVEAFRILRFSMGYMQHATQVLAVTSSTPGQGKSFTSRNLAIILAMAGKKVLLIDADIRKGTLSHHFGKRFGLTTYLADEHSRLEEIIEKDKLCKGVDFIPSGDTPPNPSELLMSNRLTELVEQLRTVYDHIIFDTTPMFAVADAGIIATQSDMTLFVVRVNVQERSFLTEIDNMYRNNRFNNLCFVINGVTHTDNSYGYGYGYGYGRNQKKKSTVERAKEIIDRLRH